MRRDTPLINKQSNKAALFVKQDATHTWIKIDGIVTSIPNNLFKKIYEVAK